jgi:hypothetical protein
MLIGVLTTFRRPGDDPPCILHLPLVIAGDWQGFPLRVRAPRRFARCISNCMGLILRFGPHPAPWLTKKCLRPKFFIPHKMTGPTLSVFTLESRPSEAAAWMENGGPIESSRSITRKMGSVYTAKSASPTQKMVKRSSQSSLHWAVLSWCAHQAEVWSQAQRCCLATRMTLFET